MIVEIIESLLVLSVLIACIRAVYTDWKYRYIEDELTYGLIIIGVVLNGIISLITWNYLPILFSIVSAGAVYAIGYLRFYFGELGGGDVKLFTGILASLPTYPLLLAKFLPHEFIFTFAVTLFINVFFLGVIYQLFYLVYKSVSERKKFSKEYKSFFRKYKSLYFFGAGIMLLLFTYFFRKSFFVVSVIIIIFYWLSLLLFSFALSAEKLMVFYAKPSQVEEGDKPIKNILLDGKLIYKKRRIGLITSDLEILRKLEKQGKINQIKFRDGIPYAPAFLLGVLFSVLVGDLISALLQLII